ncbi:response regulator [Nocardia seriolae]|nr:response regulator transcription factor [Nocardia seriolae]APA97780.1 Chemotaxis response regulator protein-glutamate methylesterase [Nocardia seriolae]OJF79809.1 hypothetical protein NS14008_12145 [Nocardia seriolae]QOW36255.1 response regulator transcription factor [Nocardia seriolae]QUN16239.1 response regulator transcription factor [Nocardia seriolae]WKY55076.1 response regulator transcription factor [Nocardia seriolae]
MDQTDHLGPPRLSAPSRRPVRVVLIDRDPHVRAAIADLITIEPDIDVVGQAGSLAAGSALVTELTPHVVVLDPHLPDGDGLELCRNLRAGHSPARCLVLSTAADPDAMADAVQAGAAGYIVKDLTELALGDAIKAIAGGRSRLDRPAAPTRHHRGDRELLAALTGMELSILLLLAEGLTHQQIAGRLFFAENTIRTYVARILRKLGLDDPAHAADYASRLREIAATSGEPHPDQA